MARVRRRTSDPAVTTATAGSGSRPAAHSARAGPSAIEPSPLEPPPAPAIEPPPIELPSPIEPPPLEPPSAIEPPPIELPSPIEPPPAPAIEPPSPIEPPHSSMGSTRQAVLVALKRRGVMRAGDLAAELGITVAAVRQQLGRLEDDGLLTHKSDPEGRGRPAHRYELSPLAEALFPKRYGDLTTELLGYMGGPQSQEVASLFEQRRRRRLHEAEQRLKGRALDEQVAELTRILDEDGYLADVEALPGGGWRITEHNCAILSVATGYRQACTSELAFIRDALPAGVVERVAHRLEGAHVCSYEVRPR